MKRIMFAANGMTKRSILDKIEKMVNTARRTLLAPATVVEIICALHIILFIYTGVNKMLDYGKFQSEMARSPFIQNFSGLLAATLPAGELLIALALIIKKTRLIGLYASFFIMAMFTGYIWLMLNYSYDLPCSCGGILAAMTWNDHLIFNAVFTLLAMTGLLLQSKMSASHNTKAIVSN